MKNPKIKTISVEHLNEIYCGSLDDLDNLEFIWEYYNFENFNNENFLYATSFD